MTLSDLLLRVAQEKNLENLVFDQCSACAHIQEVTPQTLMIQEPETPQPKEAA